MKHKPIDATGRCLRVGDLVRVIGVPDLSGMIRIRRARSLPVFEYLVGKYKTVREFDEYGLAWLHFRISKGPHRGLHSVAIEPGLLKLRTSHRRAFDTALKRERR